MYCYRCAVAYTLHVTKLQLYTYKLHYFDDFVVDLLHNKSIAKSNKKNYRNWNGL